MTPLGRFPRAPVVFAALTLLAAPIGAELRKQAEEPVGAARPEGQAPSLAERLAAEEASLARMRAELEKLEAAAHTATPQKPPSGPPGAGDAPKPEGGDKEKPKTQDGARQGGEDSSPLLRRPSMAAADVLYRLGRYARARALYEALAGREGLEDGDRIWALLQAGNCCRRLGLYDAAIEHFQTLMQDYPDNPWCKGHVAWTLKTAQWEKRWERLQSSTGE
ncbi:MAG: tetratricopeptide repeat protein [Candidatus Brocadiia bacterium]